jgi:hypothetical protein
VHPLAWWWRPVTDRPICDQGLTPELMAEMVQNEQFLLSISERGFGKRSSAYAYRCANRGGQGVATMDVTVRTGLIVNCAHKEFINLFFPYFTPISSIKWPNNTLREAFS